MGNGSNSNQGRPQSPQQPRHDVSGITVASESSVQLATNLAQVRPRVAIIRDAIAEATDPESASPHATQTVFAYAEWLTAEVLRLAACLDREINAQRTRKTSIASSASCASTTSATHSAKNPPNTPDDAEPKQTTTDSLPHDALPTPETT